MSNFFTDDIIVLRVSEYKDNKSIVTALSKNRGFISFSVKSFRKFKSSKHGKFQRLNLINAEFIETQNQVNISQINKTQQSKTITDLVEFKNQQKITHILLKAFKDLQSDKAFKIMQNFIENQYSYQDNLALLLIKLADALDLIQIDPNLKPANAFHVNINGVIINRKESPILSIDLKTLKTIRYYQANDLKQSVKLKTSAKIESQVEELFKILLGMQYGLSINFRNFNNIFNGIQLHN
ncbi:hypothetical protein HOH51_02225 [bacterium]|nr:hypothetical protein [bacterium]